MKKVFFIEWGIYETKLNVVEINDEGLVKDVQIANIRTINGGIDYQVKDILSYIDSYKPCEIYCKSDGLAQMFTDYLKNKVKLSAK